MLKDVEMTMPKRREYIATYMQHEGSIFICNKTGDEGSIYVARQGIRACNNNNMRDPIINEM